MSGRGWQVTGGLLFPLLVLAVLLPGPIVLAAPVTVVVTWQGDPDTKPNSVEFVLTPLSALEDADAGRSVLVEVPGESHFDLPLETVWRLRGTAESAWVRETIFAVQASPALWPVQVFPTATIDGRLVVPAEADPVDELNVRLQSPPGESNFDPVTVRCPVRTEDSGEQRWRCEAPAGTYDLRLRTRGFAPVYSWSHSLAAGEVTDFGELHLTPGASLSGFVVLDPEPTESIPVTVELRPSSVRPTHSIPDEQRMTRQHTSTTVDARGHFQVTDLSAGEFFIVAKARGYAQTVLGPLAVFEPVETSLEEPLLLRPPASLQVVITPPLAPSGDPWRLRLRPIPTPGRDLSTTLGGHAQADGSWEVDGLPEGGYYLEVRSASTHWLTEALELRAGDPLRQIEVPLVTVQGELTWVGEPRPISLWFVEMGSRKRSRFILQEEQFEGYLPYEGWWQVLLFNAQTRERHVLEPVEVEVSAASGVARVEIEIPAGRIEGRVLDPEGEGVEGVEVQLMPRRERREASTTITGAGGGFLFDLLAAGDYLVSVDTTHHALVSEEVHLQDRLEHPEVLLRLEDEASMLMRVTTDGAPLPGVQVLAMPRPAGHYMRFPDGVTGVEGNVELKFPRRTTHLDALVFPPGYAVRLLHVMVQEDIVEVPVQRVGGALTLRWSPDAQQGPSLAAKPVLVRDGMTFSLMTFLRWARDRGVWEPEHGRVSIPMLEPGNYTVCLAGKPASEGACQSGFVPPGGELLLTLP